MSDPFVPAELVVPVVCRLLRTKSGHGAASAPWQLGLSTTACYRCLATMEAAGPDEGLAHAHLCRAGRACFQGPSA